MVSLGLISDTDGSCGSTQAEERVKRFIRGMVEPEPVSVEVHLDGEPR